ncbi:hypothetical protein A2U01_0095558, partial [Trifolium medium]|nr:hypothetical protein [Trifolium medium]
AVGKQLKSHDCHKGQSFRCRVLRYAEDRVLDGDM